MALRVNQISHSLSNGHTSTIEYPRESLGLQTLPLNTESSATPDFPTNLPGVPNVAEVQALRHEESSEPVLDIVISNVVCSFSVRCHLNLRQIALDGVNVEYRRENAMVTMKLRRPRVTASIWSSGKITCTGSTSEEESKTAARKVARCLQKMGFKVHFRNFRVVNVLGTCSMPFSIKIDQFSIKHRGLASYEPELHPGVTYKIKDLRATLKIFSTGSITVTAPCIANVQMAVEQVFPLVYEFQRPRIIKDNSETSNNSHKKMPILTKNGKTVKIDDECAADELEIDDTEEEDFPSDQSCD